jgi:hypothetical protein
MTQGGGMPDIIVGGGNVMIISPVCPSVQSMIPALDKAHGRLPTNLSFGAEAFQGPMGFERKRSGHLWHT